MKYLDKDEGAALKAAFDALVMGWPAVTATTMFGCPSYRVDGTTLRSSSRTALP